MRRMFLLPLFLFMFGCSQNYFNVPQESVAEKVNILGVAPIIIDADSDIQHPDKAELTALLAEMNRKYESQLVRSLKSTGNYYAVALLDSDPQALFSSLLLNSEKRDDASIKYNKYFWKSDKLRDYMKRSNLDAILLVVVSGVSRNDKIYSGTLQSSVTSDYNYLIMTAQLLDTEGTLLWEYPNFRTRSISHDPLINLQYPDFSEADANQSNKVIVKFKTITGIKNSLDKKKKDLLLRETPEPELYSKQFDEMVSLLKYSIDKKQSAVSINKTTEQPKPAAEPVKPLKQSQAAAPKTMTPAKPATDEIVPAEGSRI